MIRIFLVALFAYSASFSQAQNDIYSFPFSYQDKYGLVNLQGEIVLEPTYDNISIFKNYYQNNYTQYYQDGKYGILNNEGKEIIQASIDRMEYDGNGGFAWYYADYPNMLGLSVFSLENEKVIAGYDSLRAREVLGEGPYYLMLRNPNSGAGFIIDTEGTKLFDVPRGLGVFIEFPENDCPLLAFGNTSGYPRRTYFDCTGTQMSIDDYLDKYEVEEEMPVFSDQSIFEDATKQGTPPLEEVQARFPDLKIKKLVLNGSRRLVSIIAVNENQKYGLIDPEGNELIPFEYYNISWNQGYLYTYKSAYRGLFNVYGEEVFPTIYSRIEWYAQDHGYFRIYTHSGYMGYGSVYGNVFLPKDIPLE